MWIIATPSRDLSSHPTKEAAFKQAAKFIRRGIGRRNLDVYRVADPTPLDPEAGIGYAIQETHDIRIRDGMIVAQKYGSDGFSIGRPVVLGRA